MILAIDPGDVQSAWMLYDEKEKIPVKFAKEENDIVIGKLPDLREEAGTLAIEMIASYGMPVGKNVFETCVWIGRYWQMWVAMGGEVDLVYRKDVKMHLCHSMRAKDSNVRQAIMDRYGGSRKAAVGTKKEPGVCYGIANDIWAALGVAITWSEKTP
jgi:hypothetical protein